MFTLVYPNFYYIKVGCKLNGHVTMLNRFAAINNAMDKRQTLTKTVGNSGLLTIKGVVSNDLSFI